MIRFAPAFCLLMASTALAAPSPWPDGKFELNYDYEAATESKAKEEKKKN